MSQAVVVCPGSRFAFDGEVVEVTQFGGTRVTVRDARDRWRTLGLAGFLARAVPLEAPDGGPALVGPLLAGLSGSERSALAERAGHVREVLTGYRSGTAEVARPGEPRPDYDPAGPLSGRQEAKAGELGVTGRTIRRWVRAYRDSGEAGLADARRVSGRHRALDPRWEEACRMVVAGQVTASTPTAGALLRLIGAQLDEQSGPGVVPRPSTATAYRHLARLTKGTNALKGSAKGRRSIADRPTGTYGRLRAVRPGEYAVLDTQDLGVFAMEPVTCRWVRAQLTVAQDLFTRGITGLRVTPVSAKAVDVAGVLYQAIVPQPAPEDWPDEACWRYHGVPQHLVFTEQARLPGIPVCPPETLVIDHGKAFLSAHVISVCIRLGISIQPAHSRGKQDGLAVPEWPHLRLSPDEMYEIGIAKAGLLRIPAFPELAYDFLATEWRTIQHYGVEVGGLRCNGAALDPYRNAESPHVGVHGGKWPVRVNPDDVRYVYFQDPADDSWHRLEWEHAPGLGTPFSAEAAQYARQLAARQDRWPDPEAALAGLLARWDQGMVTGRRERRMAARLAAGHAALAVPGAAEPEGQVVALPGIAATGDRERPELLRAVGGTEGDDDDAEEIFDAPGDSGFYADAFEVLE